jgi:hypothetical protein
MSDFLKNAQHVDTKGFRLEFAVTGFGNLAGRSLEVRIQRPDESIITKSMPNDVIVVDASSNIIAVAIIAGDFTQEGVHYYQAFDITGGIFVSTNKGDFYVDSNLAPVAMV